METGWALERAWVLVQEQARALVRAPVASEYVRRCILPMHRVEVEVGGRVECLAVLSSTNQSSCSQTWVHP